MSAGALAKAARVLGLPMTFSVVPEGGRPGQLIPELAEFATEANTFVRTSASPFLDLPTTAALNRNSRNILVVAGFSAEVVVLHTALDALALGYEVQVPLDAVGARTERTEGGVLRQIERAGGVSTSILTLITRLEPDLANPLGSLALDALKALRGG